MNVRIALAAFVIEVHVDFV